VNESRLTGTVRIIGAGLLGTSIGLALAKHNVDVVIEDSSPANQSLAIDYGAGRRPASNDTPSLIVVCVPPDVTASVILAELASFPEATVTDVASVKFEILQQLERSGENLTNYVGSHPMAGRERGGAIAGRADLFVGRPWVIAAHANSERNSISKVEALALELGAAPMAATPAEHDRAVALVSHVPQLVSSLLAARLVGAAPEDVALAGQGLRDTTRIAASDPKLWLQILDSNAQEVSGVLKAFALDLDQVIDALDHIDQSGSLAKLGRALEAGNRGVERIPGKHGSKATAYSQVIVMIADKPGELGRLFNEVGEIGVNIEELKLEHSPSSLIGLVELFVLPQAESQLVDELVARGWRLAG
jgi:prephenate dehydrogenase